MPLRLDIVSEDGAARSVAIGAGRNRVPVSPAEQFRLVGGPGDVPADLRAVRSGNALVVTGLRDAGELELTNFFGACRPGRDCALTIDVQGAPVTVLTNETAPAAALADGSFLLLGSPSGLPTLEAVPAAAAADSGLGRPALLGGTALLALGVAAAAGGGGGGGGGPVAVLSSGATAADTGATTTPPTATAPTAPAAAPVAPVDPAPVPVPSPDPVPPPAPADVTPPVLTITDDAAGVVNRAVRFTFSFSEPVVGFTASDVTVTGGARGELQQGADAQTWTLTVTPTSGVQSGQIVVDVAARAATDAAGNPTAAVRATQAYDTRAPEEGLRSFSVVDDRSPSTGTLRPGQTTNDTTPTVTLTLDRVLGAGEVLSLSRNGTIVRTLSSGREISFTESTLPGASVTYTASIADSAGNTTVLDLNGGTAGTGFSFLIVP
jgi:hypothetical protein